MKLTARVGAVEFDGDTVRLAIVKTGGKLPTVLELHRGQAVYEQPDERFEALVEVVRRLAAEVKTKPTVYLLCASSAQAVVRTIKVPFKGRRRVEAAAPFELEPYLAFPIDELVIDQSIVRELNGETEVLAAGLRVEHLQEQIAILEAAGVSIEEISLDVAGLTGLWMATRQTSGEMLAVLHVRAAGAILAVVHNRSLVFFRHIPLTARQILDKPGAAGREAQNTLRSFLASREGGQDLLASVTVTGVELVEEQRESFEAAFRVPVHYDEMIAQLAGPGLDALRAHDEAPLETEAADDSASLTSAEDEDDEDAREGEVAVATSASSTLGYNTWEAVIGVGASAAGGGFSFAFRKGPLAKERQFREYLRNGVFSAILAVIALIGYSTYVYLDYRDVVEELERIDHQMWAIYSEAFPDASEVQSAGGDPPYGWRQTYQALEDEIRENPELGGGLPSEVFSMPTLLDVLLEISEAMPEGEVNITNLRIRGSRNPRIEVEGEVEDPTAFNEAFAALRESPLFTIDEEPVRRVEGGKQTFTIVARR